MSKLRSLGLQGLIRDPRILVLLAPFLLMSPVWATGKAIYWGTPSTQFIPWWYQAWQTIRAGHLPLWNPLLGMGAPLLANYQSALLYPPNWIYFLLAELGGLPWMAWGMAPMIAAHLAWAGLGMLLLLRRLGLGILAQSIGGLAFGLSGYLVARAHFLSINAAVAWLPWILLAAFVLVQKQNAKSVLILALPLALQWLAGHAQISWYSLLLLLAWTAFWAWRAGRWTILWKVGILMLGVGILALALSAIQLIPTAEYLLNSQRASEVESQFALSYSFWPWRFISLFAPNFFGNPITGDYWGFANYWEDAVYIGLLPILLVLFALLRIGRKQGQVGLKLFLFAAVALSFLLALGNNTSVFPWLYENVPSFDMFQAPTRFSVWAVFALSVLAALAAQAWQRPTGRRLYWSRLAVAAALSIVLAAGAFRSFDLGSLSSIEPSIARATFTMGLIALGITVLNLLAPKKGDETSPRWTWVVVLLLSADLLWAGWGLNPGIDLDFYREHEGEYAELNQQLGDGRIYLPRADEELLKFERFFRFDTFATDKAVRSALLPNTSLLNGISSANNFDPLRPARYENWLDALEASERPVEQDMLMRMGVTKLESVADEAALNEEFSQIIGLPRLRWLPCSRYVVNQEEALALIVSGEVDPGVVIVESQDTDTTENCDSTLLSATQLAWLAQSPNRLLVSVSAADEGWLLLADTWYPGWQARVDGRQVPIYPADALFRAVQLPAGEYEVEFLYRPLSFSVGATTSAVAWIALLIAWRKITGRKEN